MLRAWYVHLPSSELDIVDVAVPLSTRLMPLFGPSTTFECAATDSVPPYCDVQVNESITVISLIAGSILTYGCGRKEWD